MRDIEFNLTKIQHYRNMPDLVAESLKEAILHGEFKGGVQLKQDEIAKHFDVSLIPVREALIQLESKGLVKCIRNKGALVTQLSEEEMQKLFELKSVLEVGSIMLMKEKASKEHLEKMAYVLEKLKNTSDSFDFGRYDRLFYQLLCECGGNSELTHTYDNLFIRIERYLIYMYHLIPDRACRYERRLEILNLLESDNREALIHIITDDSKVLARGLIEFLKAQDSESNKIDWNIYLPFSKMQESS